MAEQRENNWYTVTETVSGEVIQTTFRVRSPDSGAVVDPSALLEALVGPLYDLADSGQLLEAATGAYRSIEVDIWCGPESDDTTAVPLPADDAVGSPDDVAVDLWLPMQLAVVLQNQGAIDKLLRFHEEFGVAVVSALAADSELPPATTTTTAHSVEEAVLPCTRSGTEYEDSAAGPAGAAGSGDSARSTSPAAAPARVPLFTCHVRPDFGNALVLLGCHVAPASAAGRRSYTRPAPAEDPTGTPRSHPLPAPLPPPPTAAEEAAFVRRNMLINDLEQEFLADAGGELCVANVMGALRPLLARAVEGLREATAGEADPTQATSVARFALDTARQHCACVGDLLRKPVLIVDGALVYDLCDGDLDLLTALVEVFQGSLTPILTGKRLSGGHGGALGSAALSPALHSLNATCRSAASRSSSGAPTPHSHGMGSRAPSTTAMRVAGSSPHTAGAVSGLGGGNGAGEPFWLSCAPQEAQRLAFYAVWVSLCEQLGERPGSARQRRVGNLVSEARMMLSSFKKLREMNHVPSAAMWSGHVMLVAKMLSHDCTVEEFLDAIGEGGSLTALSASSVPGSFAALLAAGAAAAARVTDAPALRLLSRKVEALLVEVPGRTSTLRAFLTSRPTTHAERFEELWLAATPYSEPKKFMTRVEMLFFATVELALLAAERAWRRQQQPGAPAATATLGDPKKRAEAQAALQGYLVVWRSFLLTLRDRPPPHRRSISRSRANSASLTADGRGTPRGRLLPEPTGAPAACSPAPTAGTTATTPLPPPPPQQQQQLAESGGGELGAPAKEAAVETEALTELAEVVRRVCASLPGRLQHGRDPLPALYSALYPGGQESDGGGGGGVGVGVGAAAGGGGGGSEGNGAGAAAGSPGGPTTAMSTHPDKSLPIPSLDSEFHHVQQCFADEAERESNEIKLKFYGLYKQATVGDINVSKPWVMDMVGRAKWEAWNRLKGMSLVDAKRMYVNEYKVMKQMRADKEGGSK